MIRAIVGLGLAAYPLAIYFLMGSASSALLVAIFGAMFMCRLLLLKNLPTRYVWLAGVALALFCWGAYVDQEMRTFKMYPVLINAGAALYGLYTLVKLPAAITRLTRAMGVTVEGPAIPYTYNLTIVWIVFFVLNASIAGYTALATPIGIWALYNGFISYVLIGLLFALEYPVRRAYRKRHGVTQ